MIWQTRVKWQCLRSQFSQPRQHQFERILTEPANALTTQQTALLQTEGVRLKFTSQGVAAMAQKAFEINKSHQNIGARRLYAVMEKVLERISFDAPDHSKKQYVIDEDYVLTHLKDATDDEDLNVFGFGAALKTK